MNPNRTKNLLDNGLPAIGTGAGYGSPWAAGALAQAGFDWVLMDTQHGVWDTEALHTAILAVSQAGATPVVRVLQNNFGLINRILDDGVLGVIVPMVDTAEDAEQAADAMRYPPQGRRSMANPYLTTIHGDHYSSQANDRVFLAVQIESATAVDNAEDILSTDGVDGCWVGPADMALTMGLTLDDIAIHQQHNEAVAHVVTICQKLGKFAGYACSTIEMGKRRISEGFTFVNVGGDSMFIAEGSKRYLEEMRG